MLIRAVTAGAVLVATVATAAPASADTGISGGKSYTVTMTSLDGVTPKGFGHWRMKAGLLAGGEPAVIESFNAASQASAQNVIDSVCADAPNDLAWDFESETHVAFRSLAIGQVISGTWSAEMRAQVIRYVGTVVVDSRSGQPIEVVDLFTDHRRGLDRLAEQTKILTNYDGLAATPENFANWIPTADGIELHFPSSLLFSPPAITVPWSELTDVLAPDMVGLAQA
ncbi:hypothetical protein [Mycolicibacterium tusciae]|uniref:hypothetical protein n=1 Tax=Mycolicibacterium tusciae TaxID=75922 RepID=UPI00024A2A7A|nr:hypothetical protein [Mycolicibacterium tusciae]